jgi:RNA polymerase sigma factor
MDLTRCSPKSKKTREACKKAVNALLNDAGLQAELINSGQLPIRALTEMTGLPRKLLDNHRRYIIAANELLSGEYPGLAEYLTFIKKAGQ